MKEEIKPEWIEADDVFLVEDKIKELDNPTPRELLQKLPNGFNKKILNNILYYFLKENMILMDKCHIVWIHNPIFNKLLHKRGYVVL